MMTSKGTQHAGGELAVVLVLFAAVAVGALVALGPGVGGGVVAVLAAFAMLMVAGEYSNQDRTS